MKEERNSPFVELFDLLAGSARVFTKGRGESYLILSTHFHSSPLTFQSWTLTLDDLHSVDKAGSDATLKALEAKALQDWMILPRDFGPVVNLQTL
jgi:hypothetical protein